MTPRMTEAERNLFQYAISGKASLLEFGCGGSTVMAVENNVSRILSVESDKNWIESLSRNSLIDKFRKSGGLIFFHADIGKTGDWGFPLSNDNISNWPSYWKGVWKHVGGSEVDCILIDGRFRVSCALYALPRLKEGAFIIFHDFWSRPEYHVVLKYMTSFLSVDDMALLLPKRGFDREALFDDLIAHAFNPA